ncbi:BTAD domain-containing putative transcriptional regulator [Nonomuraea indica]|uniref:BTAD domain-containing putative transcriptional regulator n=1 Tax=Nonomuraea indica TaxID=1581193 RepID=UPI000C7DB812|nr:BTAD domain-containing putative transcriptional regulator [Nonomuraea indica]
MLAGIGALVVLVALVGGVPYALLTFVGPPVAPELLDVDLLFSQVGPSTIVAVLVLLVWLAWLQLFACVVVEVYAGVRRVGMPARVPLSGGTQALANRLVSAVLLLFTAGAVAVPIARLGAPAPAAPPMTAVAYSAPVVEQVLETQRTKKVYVVQPPHGRHHESLWEIAEKCLGDGRRYPEIFRLNQHKEQPDGARLRMADLIRPGWVLDMPDDARNVHVVPVTQARAQTLREHPGKAATTGRIADRAEQTVKEELGKRLPGQESPDRQGAGETRADRQGAGEARADRQGAGEARADRQGGGETRADAGRAADQYGSGLDLVDFLAGASLAAAGLLAALGRRRREQLWRRAFGRRVVRPRDDAASAEVALRIGADAPGTRILDVGLRLLGAELAAQGRTPPTVYAAHLSARNLDLWIHPPDGDAPEPWTVQDGGQVWRLAAHEGRLLTESPTGGAPYPGLVSLGTDAGGRVLVDLEAAQGLINIRGPQTTAALAALAVELATNRWSDRMRVTLVGFGTELTAIAPGRVRAVGGLAEVLPELEAAAAPRQEVLTGRVTGSPRVAHYLLSAVTPTHDEARRLALLARRDTAGYVVAGDVPHATWTLEITEDGKAKIAELGFEVTAQLLPRRHYQALIDLFRTAERMDGEPLSPARPLEDLHPPEVEIRLLGPVEIAGLGPLEEGRMGLAAEMLVYLATHPGGVHPAVLGGVLWPRGVQTMVRDAAIGRVADWLGPEHLLVDDAGRLSLGPRVRTDWALFRELVRRAERDPTARVLLLERALGLVRGPLLSGRPAGRYAWLAADDLEYDVTALVADVAHRLCEIRLHQGAPEAAVAAVRAALLLAADDEALWRDLLRATHATGDPVRLRAVVDTLTGPRRFGSYGGLAPETEALIDELLPMWRIHVVRESTA